MSLADQERQHRREPPINHDTKEPHTMTEKTLEEQVRNLADRAEITDLIGKYCYGMDSRNWKLYRSIYTDEIEVDFVQYNPATDDRPAWESRDGWNDLFDPPLGIVKADDWVRGLKLMFDHLPQSQHIKTPISFDFSDDGNHCEVLSVMQGKHWGPTPTGEPIQAVIGYYQDKFVRTEDGWRMCSLKELVHWNEGNSHVLDSIVIKLVEVLREAQARQLASA
jgi:SnoaL-like domain